MTTVHEKDLVRVLEKFREFRRWSVENRIDPWAFRQGLLLALGLDTMAALEHGIKLGDLSEFDETVTKDLKPWVGKVHH